MLQIRKDSPLPRVIKEKVPDNIKKGLQDRFKTEAKNLRRVQVAAIKQAYEFYRKMQEAMQHEHAQQPVCPVFPVFLRSCKQASTINDSGCRRG